MINAPWPSTSVYAQCEPSKTGWWKALGSRLQDTHTQISTAAGVWQSSLHSHHPTPLSYSWPSHAPSSGTLFHAHTDAAYKQDNAFQSWNQTKGKIVAFNVWHVAVSHSTPLCISIVQTMCYFAAFSIKMERGLIWTTSTHKYSISLCSAYEPRLQHKFLHTASSQKLEVERLENKFEVDYAPLCQGTALC